MPFQFTLQPLLDLRERVEDERKRDYAQGLAQHQQVVAAWQGAQLELTASVTRLRSEGVRSDPRAMEDAFAEVSYLREIVAQAQRKVAESEETLTELRERLLEASKDKNVLDKLKERRREAYFEARRLREEQEIDDVNVIRASNAATNLRTSEEL